MSIKRRLEKLERHMEGRSACKWCRRGGLQILIRWPDGTEDPEPKPCPVCGEVGRVLRVRFIEVGEDGGLVGA